jgi:hypothetical protein
MLHWPAHMQLGASSRRCGAPTTRAVPQQHYAGHPTPSRRAQHAKQQRIQAQSSNADKRDEIVQQTRGTSFDDLPDVAPPSATGMRDTESLLQQLNALKRCTSLQSPATQQQSQCCNSMSAYSTACSCKSCTRISYMRLPNHACCLSCACLRVCSQLNAAIAQEDYAAAQQLKTQADVS